LVVVAVRVICWVVPSGSLNEKLTWSPLAGWVVRLTEPTAGEPAGPLVVTAVPVADTALSLSPKGELSPPS